MYPLLLLGISSFVLSLTLTPIVRDAFHKLGVVDRPDAFRKLHSQPVPRVGGVPIAISCGLAYAILLLSPLQAGTIIQYHVSFAWKLLPAVVLIFATGLIDDLIGLKPWQKLTGQLAAAVWAYWAGVRILAIAGYSTESWWSLPLTVLWLIGCTNAFNLIDGIDGLASGLGLFATLTTFIAALLQDNVPLALATVPLAGCLLGFLRYNFNPASIFLGDSGSLLIGFLLGCYGVIWSHKAATFLGMTAPLMALAVPILDVGLSIVRRFIRHQPIFGADHGHIHHQLLERGFTPRRVALILYGVCGLAAGFSLLQSMVHDRFAGLIIVLFCAVTWIGVQHLGYLEFGVASRMLLGGGFRRLLNAQLCLRTFEQSLAAAKTVDDFWLAVREACKTLGFSRVRLYLSGEIYEQQIGKSDPEDCWDLRIPLSESSYINFSRAFHSPVQSIIVAPFVDALRSGVQSKLAQFEFMASPPTTVAISAPSRVAKVARTAQVSGR